MEWKYRHAAVAAAAAFACAAAPAQDRAAEQSQTTRNAWQDSLAYDEYLAGRRLHATDLLGSSVQNEQGETLGEVEDLVVSRQDDVIEAVISVGGALGVGDKRIGVPYERLRISRDGETLFLAMTREQLEAQPELDADVAGAAPVAGESAAHDEPRVVAGQVVTEPDGAGRQPVAEQPPAQAQQQERRARAGRLEGQQPVGEAQPPAAGRETTVMSGADHRATDLIGMSVVSSSGEQVGEIDDLVVSPADGRIQAVLALGGVLGVGERLVSLPLEELDIVQRAEDAGDTRTVRVPMTSQELQSQPEFQYPDEERTAGIRQ